MAMAGGQGCNLSVTGSGLLPLSLTPPLAAHESRVLAAALAGAVDLDQVYGAATA
jgi:hypothetical protein